MTEHKRRNKDTAELSQVDTQTKIQYKYRIQEPGIYTK